MIAASFPSVKLEVDMRLFVTELWPPRHIEEPEWAYLLQGNSGEHAGLGIHGPRPVPAGSPPVDETPF